MKKLTGWFPFRCSWNCLTGTPIESFIVVPIPTKEILNSSVICFICVSSCPFMMKVSGNLDNSFVYALLDVRPMFL